HPDRVGERVGLGLARPVAILEQLDDLARQVGQQLGLVELEGRRDGAAASASEGLHTSLRSSVAHSPYSCMAWTCRSCSSRRPLETTALPSSCTASMRRVAFSSV